MPPDRPSAIHPLQFEYLRQFLRDRTGMALNADKQYFVELRLSMVAESHGFATIGRLLESLRTEEAWGVLHTAVAEGMAVTETSFFRDHHPFEELKHTLLPRLIERRAATRTLTIWCASVASGQEPYSLAMMIREHFPELASWKVRLIATDFSQAMLARCRDGYYSQIEVNRGLPVPYLVKYFTQEGRSWRIREDLRGMLDLRELNLIQPWPILPAMDLILMRNVLIYFSPETCRRVLRRTGEVLREDGYLLLGGSESSLPPDAPFEPALHGRTLVQHPRIARVA